MLINEGRGDGTEGRGGGREDDHHVGDFGETAPQKPIWGPAP
jgi:hypothetical protein